ncbi:MAG TPA: hypothetical protein VFS63_06845 [Pseudolabrys sp.]|nr:hypothetical protein [Pseudolabrys sp.]
MALIGRIFVILFALILAALAAGIVTAIGLLHLELHVAGNDPIDHAFFWGVTAFASGIAVLAGFLPTLIGIVVAEAFSIRSLLAYAIGGAAIVLVGYYGAGFGWTYEESIDHPPPSISREAEIAAAAGATFGFVYWLVAGRNAGRWRKRS